MKTLITLCTVFVITTTFGQPNATDVTVTDCSGNTHNLFNELDAGKIIVVGWAMPCAACAAPLLSVHNAVLNAQLSNPGMIEYWLNDDYANTSCQSIIGWANSNGITNATYFSAGDLDMLDYGSAGMPKAVILGCTDHKVYYNVNNNPGGTQFVSALQTAINDVTSGCQQSGLNEETQETQSVHCMYFPNQDVLRLQFKKEILGPVTIDFYSMNGARVFTTSCLPSEQNNEMNIPVSLWNNGLYIMRVRTSESEYTQHVEIIH